MSRARLTLRRIEILKLVAEGYSTEEISKKMKISIGNVYKQISGANRHFGVRDRQEAVVVAKKQGFIKSQDLQKDSE